MKYLVFLAVLLLTACASTTNTGSNDTIKVIGSGNTYEQAKQNGFKQAIEIVVGTVLVTGKESHDDILTKNDIVAHSSGYVDDFKVVNQYSSLGKVNLVMEVKVRDSIIANRILNKSKQSSDLNGEQLTEQYNTYYDTRLSGDELIEQVLGDYPKNAVVIKTGEVSHMLDDRRNSVIVIKYDMRWNYNYLKALDEVFKLTSDQPTRSYRQNRIYVSAKDPKAFIGGWTHEYPFDDLVRLQKIINYVTVPAYVYANIYDRSGTLIHRSCHSALMPFGFTDTIRDISFLQTSRLSADDIIIPVAKDGSAKDFLSKIDRIDLTYEKGNCYK